MNVQLALFKGKGQIGNALIRWWTGSQYSHCELVVEGYCYSSSLMDKGVRCKKVGPGDDEISLAPDKWDLIELPWADGKAILTYFTATDDQRYGLIGLLVSQIFNRNQPTPGAQFCSEWVASALKLPSPSTYSPATLATACEYMNAAKRNAAAA